VGLLLQCKVSLSDKQAARHNICEYFDFKAVGFLATKKSCINTITEIPYANKKKSPYGYSILHTLF